MSVKKKKKSITVKFMWFKDNSHYFQGTRGRRDFFEELDIKTFSDILMQTDEKAANDLVLKQAFEGLFSIDNTDFLSEILDNEDLLNDIAK